MQAAKNALESVKETAANIGASAMSGLEKTKATVQEKAERTTAQDEVQKEMAAEKKEERIHQAELEKQQAREYNAASKQSTTAGYMDHGHYTNTGAQHTSAMPAHDHGLGLGQPTGNDSEGGAGSQPVETNTGVGMTTAQNTHVGGTAPGYGLS